MQNLKPLGLPFNTELPDKQTDKQAAKHIGNAPHNARMNIPISREIKIFLTMTTLKVQRRPNINWL
jgi:hypothetical protein